MGMDVRFRVPSGLPVSKSVPLSGTQTRFGSSFPVRPVTFGGQSSSGKSSKSYKLMDPKALLLMMASLTAAAPAYTAQEPLLNPVEQVVQEAKRVSSLDSVSTAEVKRPEGAPHDQEIFKMDHDIGRVVKWASEGNIISYRGPQEVMNQEMMAFRYRKGDYQATIYVSKQSFEDSSKDSIFSMIRSYLSFGKDNNERSRTADNGKDSERFLSAMLKLIEERSPKRLDDSLRDEKPDYAPVQRPEGAPESLQVFSGEEQIQQVKEWAKNGQLRYYLGVKKNQNTGEEFMAFRYRKGDYKTEIRIPLEEYEPKARQDFRQELEALAQEHAGRSLNLPPEPIRNQIIDPQTAEAWAEEGYLKPTYQRARIQGEPVFAFQYNMGSQNRFYVPASEGRVENQQFIQKMEALSGQKMRGGFAAETATTVVQASGAASATETRSSGSALMYIWPLISIMILSAIVYQIVQNRKNMKKQEAMAKAGGPQGAGNVGEGAYKNEFEPILDSDVRFEDVGGQDEAVKRMKQGMAKFQARRTRLLELKKIQRTLRELESLMSATKTLKPEREAMVQKLYGAEPDFKEILKESERDWQQFTNKRLPQKKKELKVKIQELIAKDKKEGGKPDGVLMYGPPGTGKTLLAAAVAGEAGVPFISVDGSGFDEKFIGVGAARVRDMFMVARESAEKYGGVVLFIDEIDGMTSGGEGSLKNDTLAKLKAEMESLASKSGIAPNILVMAASNKRTMLDEALTRPGRLGTHLELKNPAGWQDRLAILKIGFQQTGMKMANVEVDPAEVKAAVEKAVETEKLPRSAQEIEARYEAMTQGEGSFSDEEQEAIRREYDKLTAVRNSVGVGKALEGFAKRMDNSVSGAKLIAYVKEAKLLRERQLEGRIAKAVREALEEGRLSRPAKDVEKRYQDLLRAENNPFDKQADLPTFTAEEREQILQDYRVLKEIQEQAATDDLGDADTVTEKVLTDAMFNKELGEVLPPEKWPDSKAHQLILFHEFGHGINNLLAGWDLDMVSGEPRSSGVGGFVAPKMDSNPNYRETLPDLGMLLSRLFVAMGGKAFEIASAGRRTGVTWGSGSDRDTALNILYKVIASGMVENSHTDYSKRPGQPLTKEDEKRSHLMMEEVEKATLEAATYLFENHRDKMEAMAEELVSRDEKNLFGPEAMALFEKHLGFPKVIADRYSKPESYNPEIWGEMEKIYEEYLTNDVSWKRLQQELSPEHEERIVEQVMKRMRGIFGGSSAKAKPTEQKA